jgi:hypothetical protein
MATTRKRRSAAVATSPERTSFDGSFPGQALDLYTASRCYAWDLESVSKARNEHLRGVSFRASHALAIDVRKDPTIAAALTQRVAPFRGLPYQFLAPKKGDFVEKGRGDPERVRQAAADVFDLATGPSLSPGLIAETIEWLALEGLVIWQNIRTTSPDGRAVNLRPEVWPLDCVVWTEWGGLQAQTTEGLVPIEHGDGRWTVVASQDSAPWMWGALVQLALCWVDRSFGIRDRRAQSEANGSGKPIGIMPEGTKIESKEGQAAIEVLKKLQKPRAGGVFPHGMSVEWLESVSQAWQIYREIIRSNDEDVPKVLLGTSTTSKTEGGNYIKDGALVGVRNDIVEGDLSTVERALYVGVFRPWAWANYGDAELASKLDWLIPDPDQDQRAKSYGDRSVAYSADLAARKLNGEVVDQELVDALARKYGVVPGRLGESAKESANAQQPGAA